MEVGMRCREVDHAFATVRPCATGFGKSGLGSSCRLVRGVPDRSPFAVLQTTPSASRGGSCIGVRPSARTPGRSNRSSQGQPGAPRRNVDPPKHLAITNQGRRDDADCKPSCAGREFGPKAAPSRPAPGPGRGWTGPIASLARGHRFRTGAVTLYGLLNGHHCSGVVK